MVFMKQVRLLTLRILKLFKQPLMERGEDMEEVWVVYSCTILRWSSAGRSHSLWHHWFVSYCRGDWIVSAGGACMHVCVHTCVVCVCVCVTCEVHSSCLLILVSYKSSSLKQATLLPTPIWKNSFTLQRSMCGYTVLQECCCHDNH